MGRPLDSGLHDHNLEAEGVHDDLGAIAGQASVQGSPVTVVPVWHLLASNDTKPSVRIYGSHFPQELTRPLFQGITV